MFIMVICFFSNIQKWPHVGLKKRPNIRQQKCLIERFVYATSKRPNMRKQHDNAHCGHMRRFHSHICKCFAFFSEVSHWFFSHICGKQPIFFSFCIYSENMRFYLDLPPFISSKRIYATVQIFRGNSIGGRPIESNLLYCLPALLNILLMMLLVVTNKISRARPLQICNNLYNPPISSLPSQMKLSHLQAWLRITTSSGLSYTVVVDCPNNVQRWCLTLSQIPSLRIKATRGSYSVQNRSQNDYENAFIRSQTSLREKKILTYLTGAEKQRYCNSMIKKGMNQPFPNLIHHLNYVFENNSTYGPFYAYIVIYLIF